MSIKRMAEVWENSPEKGGALLVLLALADYANDEGVCWPSMATLAHKARMDERNVRRIVGKLTKSGELELVERGGLEKGRPRANRYRVRPGGGKMSPQEPGQNVPAAGTFNPSARGQYYPPIRHKPSGKERSQARASFFRREETLREQIEADLQAARRRLNELLRPCGRPYATEPTDPAAKLEVAELQKRIAGLRAGLKEIEGKSAA